MSESRRAGLTIGALCALLLATAFAGHAAGVKFLRLESREAFLAGSLDNVSIDPLGALQLTDAVERLSDVEEPFLFAGAATPTGWVVGTGNSGRVLSIDRDGTIATLFEAEEPEIFAVWADPDGVVYAGSSPNGKVYRIENGEASEFYDPGETYIWQLARAADGDLLVATGTEGKIHKISASGRGEVFYDGEDTHARSMMVMPDGRVLVGTAGNGLILAIDPRGKARTLHDSSQAEVVAFASDSNGSYYAAVLSSEASLADLNASKPKKSGKKDESDGNGNGSEGATVTVTVDEGAGTAYTGSRPQGFEGPRSELLRISEAGAVQAIARFDDETVYDLLWERGRLWVATGLDGRLYSLRDSHLILETSVDERQIVRLLPDDPGPAFATTNAAAIYRVDTGGSPSGSYTSAALDAGQIARFGTLRWQGNDAGRVEFSFRSGMSSEPDETWSDWSDPARGVEISLAGVPEGRYIQWRADLEARGSRSPKLGEVTVSYRQVNLPPRIDSLSVLDPGEILVPPNFNPGNQTFEVTNPSRQGIFTTIGRVKQPADKRTKTLWKQGFRSLRWEVKDANEDKLTYTLSFRREDSDRWLPMVDDLSANFYSFDATVLPDGAYRFRLEASDAADNTDAETKSTEEISERVVIDNSPPTLVRVAREGGSIKAVVDDTLSPLRKASYSVDAGEWTEALPEDGLLDGQRETFVFDPPADGGFLLFRVVDAAHNATTLDLSPSGR